MDRATKICLVVNRLAEGYTDKEIIQELSISRRTYFYWKGRIKIEGHSSVIQKKKPGPDPSNPINQELKKKILYWRDKYGWGPTRIEGHLRVHCNIKISHRQIYNLLCRSERNKTIEKPRKTWGKKRFERTHSMSLLQADWKDIRYGRPMLTFIDDHSRYILASRIFVKATMYNVIQLFNWIINKYGIPEQVLTDRGSQFWNNYSDEPTQFTRFCIDNGIRHIVASKARPTTIGKIEAFHACYEREAWRFKNHGSFIKYWNFRRPHGGIGYLYPVEVFYNDMESATNSG